MRRAVRIGAAIAIAACFVTACGGGGVSPEAGAPAPVANAPGASAPGPTPGAPPPTATRELVSTLAGELFEYAAPGGASDDASANYTVENLPAWAEFDATAGVISGTPAAAQVGRYANVRIVRGSAAIAFDLEVVASASGAARLAWEPPLVRKDGTPFEDLAGYRVYYGRSPQQLTQALEIDDPAVREAEVANLTKGTWYFVATAVDSLGAESELSPVGSKTIG